MEAIPHMAFAYALGVAVKSIFTSQGVNARVVSASCYCCIRRSYLLCHQVSYGADSGSFRSVVIGSLWSVAGNTKGVFQQLCTTFQITYLQLVAL